LETIANAVIYNSFTEKIIQISVRRVLVGDQRVHGSALRFPAVHLKPCVTFLKLNSGSSRDVDSLLHLKHRSTIVSPIRSDC
jgi:hypothetical protein